MSTKYPGGVISKTAPTPSGPYADSTAPGIWTLEQQAYWQKLGQWPTAGNVNPSAFIENLFSTYLYTGTGAAQTITNGIDLSTNGGLVWTKTRSGGAGYDWHVLVDSARGVTKVIETNLTDAEATQTDLTSFTTTGYNLAAGSYYGNFNLNNAKFVSWTFRKQPKFFDVVTYTGTGSATTIAHSLGSTPGCIIVKNLDAATNWAVYHRSLGGTYITRLNRDWASDTGYENWANTDPTSTVFTVGNGNATNGAGYNYVAYVFAHNAGGFGLTGTDNVISCGSFTTDGSGAATISLGYEPQWVMTKRTDSTGPWGLYDTMRGWSLTAQNYLLANDSGAEGVINATGFAPNATGFTTSSPYDASATYIYIAIRRGPMKVPISGTSVFTPVQNSNFTAGVVIAGQPTVDMVFNRQKDASNYTRLFDRLRGSSGSTNRTLYTNTDDAETNTALWALDQQNGVRITQTVGTYNYVNYLFSRAPQFFDEVCWTRSTTTATLNHNLGVVPELIIKKDRSRAGTYWEVMPNVSPYDYRYVIYLNDTQAISGPSGSIYWNAAPTATTFDVNMGFDGSSNGDTFVAYLFATCAGVSKVGSYTGTGTTLQVNCGFTGGARFVLIKRTDSTGDWYYWDSSRGIVAGNDPYLLINSLAAEVTGTDYVDTYSAGFEISSTAPSAINASGGTFIFLAIA